MPGPRVGIEIVSSHRERFGVKNWVVKVQSHGGEFTMISAPNRHGVDDRVGGDWNWLEDGLNWAFRKGVESERERIRGLLESLESLAIQRRGELGD
jgi:hypothetical protein